MYMEKISKKSSAYNNQRKFVNKIGRHHFTHLRALAEGIDVQKSAYLYLGIDHGLQARSASRQTIDAVRAIARRNNIRSSRLIGLTIKIDPQANQMSLDDFVAVRGLDDWPEAEVIEMYKEAFPTDPVLEKHTALRQKVISLINQIETLSVETPKLSDMVSGWFDDATSARFISAGIINLDDLYKKISVGGRWYKNIPGLGVKKSKRIEAHLLYMLEGLAPSSHTGLTTGLIHHFTLGKFDSILIELKNRLSTDEEVVINLESEPLNSITTHSMAVQPVLQESDIIVHELDHEDKSPSSLLSAKNDVEAAIWWISVKAGAKTTGIVYLREVIRLLLWLKYERREKRFSDMNLEDCSAYLSFLQNIPTRWMSKQQKPPFTIGWAPFRDQLNNVSYKNTMVIVAALFHFLDQAKYIKQNPWFLINKKIGHKQRLNRIDSKAISTKGLRVIRDYLLTQPPYPELARFKFILIFISNVGLRSSELLSVRLNDFRLDIDGWELQVVGKGDKERLVAVPDGAMEALKEYLVTRNIKIDEISRSNLPLIGKLKNKEKGTVQRDGNYLSKNMSDTPEQTIGYSALYRTMQVWFKRIANIEGLPEYDQQRLLLASTHWLRHTFGTIAVEQQVPYDVIQSQMGHSSIEMIANVYGRASDKRLKSEMAKAFN